MEPGKRLIGKVALVTGGASGIAAVTRNLGQASGAAMVAVCFRLAPENGARTALYAGCVFAACGATASLLRLIAKPPAIGIAD